MKYIYTILLSSFFIIATAQEELSLYYQPEVLQAGLLNPAFTPRGTFNISSGSTYYHLDLRGPRFAEFFFGIDYAEEFAEGISRNYYSSDFSFHLLDVAWKKNNIHYRLGYHISASQYVNFSLDFINLLTFGNAEEVGRTIEFNPSIFATHMNELYFGMSTSLYDDMYKIGGNIKLISGAYNVSTPRNDISLTTGEEFYELSLETDVLMNVSANDFNFRLRELLPFNDALRDNYGTSIDFGFQYKDGPWTVNASLLDVGFVFWRSNTINIESKGEFEFNGLSFSEITTDTLSTITDSIATAFGTTVTNNRYFTYTPAKIIVSGQYKYNKWRLGGMLYGEFKQNRFLPAVGVNATRRLWKFWDVGVSYAYKNNTYSNFGLHSVMNIRNLQLYVMSDNVVGVFLPWYNWKVNFRVGANLDFGLPQRIKYDGKGDTAFLLY